jgi:hypothetical protein
MTTTATPTAMATAKLRVKTATTSAKEEAGPPPSAKDDS